MKCSQAPRRHRPPDARGPGSYVLHVCLMAADMVPANREPRSGRLVITEYRAARTSLVGGTSSAPLRAVRSSRSRGADITADEGKRHSGRDYQDWYSDEEARSFTVRTRGFSASA